MVFFTVKILFSKLNNSTGCNSFGLSVDKDHFILMANIGVDNIIRKTKCSEFPKRSVQFWKNETSPNLRSFSLLFSLKNGLRKVFGDHFNFIS